MSYMDAKKVVYLQSIYKELESLVKDMGAVEGAPTTWGSITGDQSTVSLSGFTNNAGYITSETDPVYLASPASGITSGNITNWNSAVQPADLATVATTGAYTDLTGTPTLGTAASSNVGDFATAAQGTLAGTATQPADNVSTLTNDAGYITGTTGFSGSFATATDTITVVNGLITAVTPL